MFTTGRPLLTSKLVSRLSPAPISAA
jgi:hypothetical protein